MVLLAARIARSSAVVLVGVALAAITGAGPAAVATDVSPSPAASSAAEPHPRIFLIVMENHGYGDLIGDPDAPWINAAAATAGRADAAFGVAHPSQPNYIALTSGSTNGVTGDGDVTLDVPNLVDTLESAGRTWSVYMQSLASCGGDPLAGSCGDGRYDRKHDPFVSYADVQSDPARLAHIVDLTQLDADLAAGTVADLVWIGPDECHNMHGADVCAQPHDRDRVAAGDAFLASTVSAITASSAWASGAAIVITWDEDFGDDTGCCGAEPGGGHVLTLVIDHDAAAPAASDVPVNHYSLLATIQTVLGLDCLGLTCDVETVQPMTDLLATAP